MTVTDAPRTCSRCRAAKPPSDFYTSKGASGGLRSECKECTKADVRRYRERRKADAPRYQDRIEYHRAYRASHAAEIRDYQRARYHENIEKAREYARVKARERYQRNRERILEYQKERYRRIKEATR